jgi:hypothetical protein
MCCLLVVYMLLLFGYCCSSRAVHVVCNKCVSCVRQLCHKAVRDFEVPLLSSGTFMSLIFVCELCARTRLKYVSHTRCSSLSAFLGGRGARKDLSMTLMIEMLRPKLAPYIFFYVSR